MPNPPWVYKTYQNVRNNLVYWMTVLLLISSIIIYFLFLNKYQHYLLRNIFKNTTWDIPIIFSVLVTICFSISFILIEVFKIHDQIYDRYIIRWRERYDIEFIITRLIEPIKMDLPENFIDLAKRSRYQFMVPFYEFVGDEKKGISQNSRVRFYECITLYWGSQINEMMILLYLIGTPLYIIIYSSTNFTTSKLAWFFLIISVIGILNRWWMRSILKDVSKATEDEIEEILSKIENKNQIRDSFLKLCKNRI